MQGSNQPNNSKEQITNGSNAILKAWLIAGTLDIALALLYTYIKTDKNPVFVLDYITKTAIGKSAITDDITLKAAGLIIHYAIAFVWTAVFFWAYPKLNLNKLNKILVAVLYGAFVWVMMNLVIVPLRKMEFPKIFIVENIIANAIILMIAIGLPLAFIIGDYYSKKAKQDGNY